jgi:hypothetical protein
MQLSNWAIFRASWSQFTQRQLFLSVNFQYCYPIYTQVFKLVSSSAVFLLKLYMHSLFLTFTHHIQAHDKISIWNPNSYRKSCVSEVEHSSDKSPLFYRTIRVALHSYRYVRHTAQRSLLFHSAVSQDPLLLSSTQCS